MMHVLVVFFLFKQKTAYEIRSSDWSSDVCSSDLTEDEIEAIQAYLGPQSSALGVKPVTARVIVVPAVLEAIPISVRLRPDTAATRLAVTEAFIRFIASLGDVAEEGNDSPIGALIARIRVSESISSTHVRRSAELMVGNNVDSTLRIWLRL